VNDNRPSRSEEAWMELVAAAISRLLAEALVNRLAVALVSALL
jgi:hypothetical protein